MPHVFRSLILLAFDDVAERDDLRIGERVADIRLVEGDGDDVALDRDVGDGDDRVGEGGRGTSRHGKDGREQELAHEVGPAGLPRDGPCRRDHAKLKHSLNIYSNC